MIRTITGDFDSARFEVELVPHRSIGKRGALIAIGSTAILLGTVAGFAGFLSGGKAQPFMLGIAFLIQMGLTAAFMMNARSAAERQTLKMDTNGLTLTHRRPDWVDPVITNIPVPPMARIEEKSVRGINKLILRLHAKEIPLGHFLPPVEANELKNNLKTALRNWTQDPAPHI